MTEKNDDHFLPQVEDTDLARLLFSDITEPSHIIRWEEFVKAQPVLAREILKRAYINSEISLGSLAMQKVIIDTLTFAYTSLVLAAQREATAARLPTGDVDGEALLPSGELSDGQ